MKKRIVIILLAIGIVSILISLILVDLFVSQIYIEREIEKNLKTVEVVSNNIDNNMLGAIERVESFTKKESVHTILSESNKRFAGLTQAEISEIIKLNNEKWLNSDKDDSFVEEYTQNDVGKEFKRAISARSGYYEEIFLTNIYGEMIATSSYLSDLDQSDEYWWQAAYNNGDGQFYIDDRGYDKSSEEYVIGFVAPIYDENSELIGILKVDINAQILFTQDIENIFRVFINSKIYIVRTGGFIIFGSEPRSMQQIESGEISLSKMEKQQIFRYRDSDKVKYIVTSSLISYVANNDIAFGGDAQSQDNMHGNEGELWHVLYIVPLREITYFSDTLYTGLVITLLFILILSISIAVVYVSRATDPLEKLAHAADIIGSGDLDYKIDMKGKYEIKKLADAMSRMLINLKVTLASRDELKAEMEAREKVQKEKEEMSKYLAGQQKMEAIGTLASGVAHEINNPINGIMNYAQLLNEMDDQTDAGKTLSSEIIDESKRVSNIVHNLINFSNHSTGHFSKINAKELIDQCLELISTQAMQKQVRINVNISVGIDSFDCRPQQLKQVIINLMTNAIESLDKKYNNSEQEKQIDISIKEIIKEESPWIEISIKDNGTGMEKDVQEKIFEPFFTTQSRASGTGLGLYISHSIITEHGGLLTFESEPGQGATFKIALPIVNPLKSELI